MNSEEGEEGCLQPFMRLCYLFSAFGPAFDAVAFVEAESFPWKIQSIGELRGRLVYWQPDANKMGLYYEDRLEDQIDIAIEFLQQNEDVLERLACLTERRQIHIQRDVRVRADLTGVNVEIPDELLRLLHKRKVSLSVCFGTVWVP